MVSILTITILSMISATALYVASQNGSTGVQTAAWQQALTGAESGVDRAIAALNTGSWTNWQNVSTGTLPTAEPSPSPAVTATAAPAANQENFLPSTQLQMTQTGEGATLVSSWVTVDTAGSRIRRTPAENNDTASVPLDALPFPHRAEFRLTSSTMRCATRLG